MNLQEFKQKYFTNNFYWVNENNYQLLQDIALEVGCLCHTMKKDTIKWWKNKRHQEVDFVLKDHQFMAERNLKTDD